MRAPIMHLFNTSDLAHNYMHTYDFILQFEKTKEDIAFICFFKQPGWWYMKTIQKPIKVQNLFNDRAHFILKKCHFILYYVECLEIFSIDAFPVLYGIA